MATLSLRHAMGRENTRFQLRTAGGAAARNRALFLLSLCCNDLIVSLFLCAMTKSAAMMTCEQENTACQG